MGLTFRRGLVLAAFIGVAAAFASTASAGKYVVLYKNESVASNAAATIQKAGGSVVATYPQIGVVIASSDSATFQANVLKDSRVDSASSTDGLGVQLKDYTADANGPPPGDLPNIPVTDSSEPLFGLQWDMRQIHTPEAHAITGGSPGILVGDLDTGLDFTHPDIAPNYDAANSADCSSGVPQPLLPGNDQAGHGTHTAGTIAAAANGLGIVGVAPKVKIAGIKSSNDDGFFFPEMVVCSFMWAATHGVDVTNNSYFADPWLFNCQNDPEQRAIWNAERRAIKFAMKNGVVVVAAAGNFSDDLAHPTQDVTSPDFPPGSEQERQIRNNCRVVPVEVPGVIGVSATGNLRLKSFYSNYGSGVIQVAAPGGDSILQLTPAAPNGRVLSTYPLAVPCARTVFDQGAKYCYLQGTSMAAPHVTGVAALIESWFGPLSPRHVASMVSQTADPLACPDTAIYAPFPSVNNGAPQTCTGGAGYNSFYGHGEVNAFAAVSG